MRLLSGSFLLLLSLAGSVACTAATEDDTESGSDALTRVSDGDYKTPERVATLLGGMERKFPELAKRVSIGKSRERRDIWALRIGKAVGDGEDRKPAIVINGAHHAREVMGVEVVLDAAELLLEKYGSDARITRWVDENEIWLVPMVNVDGSHRVMSGQRDWRKNTAGCPASGECAQGTGVDLNRNYPVGWGSCNGSSDAPLDEKYRGPVAASEPETKAFMGLVERVRPTFSMSYHSYAEVVFFPFGCKNRENAELDVFEAIGGAIGAGMPKDSGQGTYPVGHPWELMYEVDGGANDWMFEELGVYPFTVELNGMEAGFHPAYARWRDKTVEKARISWQTLLDRAAQSGIRGFARKANGKPIASAEVTVETPAGKRTHVTGPDGSFHILVEPGSYDLRVTARGLPASTKQVTVAGERVDVEVVLR